MIGLLKYMRGYLCIRVWGFSPERFINLCSNKNILLWNIVRDGDVYTMCISLQGFYQLRPIARKTGTRVVVSKRYGLPFLLPGILRRKAFLAGLFLTVAFWLWSSLYIWDIQLAGNYQVTKDVFFQFLDQQGIRIGMRRDALVIEDLEKEIRRSFPQITWTSARISGTRLTIDVKENDAPIAPSVEEKTETGKDLVAEYEGTIVSMIVRSGVPQVNIGDTVEKGTILVEGKVPIYQEDATIREYTLVDADADILLEHTRQFHATLPFDYIRKEYTGRTKKQYFFRLGEREWKLKMDRPFLYYDSVIRTNRPAVLEKLSIPVYGGCITHREYLNVEYEYTLDEARNLLNEKIVSFITTLNEKGVQIISKNVKIDSKGGQWTVQGEFHVKEPVGKSVETKLPDTGENLTE